MICILILRTLIHLDPPARVRKFGWDGFLIAEIKEECFDLRLYRKFRPLTGRRPTI